MKDRFNQELLVGDIVCYPRNVFGRLSLNLGRIYKISDNESTLIILSNIFYFKNRNWSSKSLKAYIQSKIDDGTLPTQFYSCTVSKPIKVNVFNQKLLKIDPILIPEDYKEVIINENWTITNIK